LTVRECKVQLEVIFFQIFFSPTVRHVHEPLSDSGVLDGPFGLVGARSGVSPW
jgi:hypothetical protein